MTSSVSPFLLLSDNSLVLDVNSLLALEQAILTTRQELQSFAHRSEFGLLMKVAFGDRFQPDQLQQAWVIGDFQQLPRIQICASATINGLNGGYVAANNTIYLSQEFLRNHIDNPQAIASVFAEEIGHFLDQQDGIDALGDEGELFSNFVRGIVLNPLQIQQIQQENDNFAVNINGQTVNLEASGGLSEAIVREIRDNLDRVLAGIQDTLDSQLLKNSVIRAIFGDRLENNPLVDQLDSLRAKLQTINIQSYSASELVTTLNTQVLQGTGASLNYNQTSDKFTFNFSSTKSNNLGFNSNLGLANVGINFSGNATLTATFNSGFDFSVGSGTFILNPTANKEFSFNFTAQNNGNLTGKLGFLDLTAANNGTAQAFSSNFSLNADLNSSGLIESITPTANLNLNSLATLSGGQYLPTFTTNLVYNSSNSNLAFNDVKVSLGSIFKTASPFIKDVKGVVDKFDPILDFLNKPLPVIDKFGLKYSILDLAKNPVLKAYFSQVSGLPPIDTSFINSISKLSNLIKKIDGLTSSGYFNLGGFNVTNSGQIVNTTSNNSANTKATSLIGDTAFTLPILSNPTSAFQLLLGNPNVDLFKFTVPGLNVNVGGMLTFPIWAVPPVSVGFGGSIGATIPKTTYGFDATGLLKYRNSGKYENIFEGLYLYSKDPATGKRAGLQLNSKLFLDVNAGIRGIASVGGEAYIQGIINLALNDPNNDGKIRWLEIKNNFNQGFSSLFDASGGVSAGANIYIEYPTYKPSKWFSGKVFERENIYEFGPIPIPGLQFGSKPASRTVVAPNLAVLSNGQLRLNIGTYAAARTNNKDDVGEVYNLTLGAGKVIVTGPTKGQEKEEFSGVSRIIGNANKGNDNLNASALNIAVEFSGGVGRDTLSGGNQNDSLAGDEDNDILFGNGGNDTLTGDGGDDQLDGGAGDDNLKGGEGSDRLYGQAGNDNLLGSIGNDTLEGGTGNDTLDGGLDNDTLIGGDGADKLLGSAGDDLLQGENQNDTLDGGYGQDILEGGEGDDNLQGGQGNDSLKGQGGNDFLAGDEGKDYLDGGVGNDTIYGGTGDDLLLGNEGIDSLKGGDGNDTLIGGQDQDYLSGDAGNDILLANSGDDSLEGGDGEDTLYGYEGIDTLTGGNGNDTLISGQDQDYVSGDAGNDSLEGNEGDDILWGGRQDNLKGEGDVIGGGDDTLFGGAGSDKLYGGIGSDRLEGEADNDELYGNADNDTLIGGQGIDSLYGGAGIDSLYGGTESDLLVGGTESDRLEGNEGDDILWGGRQDTLTAGKADDITGGDDTLFGGAGNDTLYGGVGKDRLEGEADNDELYGNADNDTLIGQSGRDTLTGGENDDLLLGGTGNDTLYGNEGNDSLYGLYEDDKLDGGTGKDSLIGGSGNDTLLGGDENDTLRGDGEASDSLLGGEDSLVGGKGNDLLWGGELKDTLLGQEGDDTLYGETGNDILNGGAGIDTVDGGEGNDTLSGGAEDASKDYLYGRAGDDSLTGNAGDDELYGGSGEDTLSGDDGNDTLTGEDGNDTLIGGLGGDSLIGGLGDDVLKGHLLELKTEIANNDGNDTLDGNEGNDELWGSDGNDSLIGGVGNDILYGDDSDNPSLDTSPNIAAPYGKRGNDTLEAGAGNDTLYGGLGDDILKAGSGFDRLYGGQGNDTLYGYKGAKETSNDGVVFVFAPGSGTDTVFDFDITKDVIFLTGGLSASFIKFEETLETIQGQLKSVTTLIDLDTDQVLAKFVGVAAADLRSRIDEQNVPPDRLEFNSKKPIYAKEETISLVDAQVRDPNGASDIEKVDFWVQDPNGAWKDLKDVGLTGVKYGNADWGDFDKDGDLDVLVTGYTAKVRSEGQKDKTFDLVPVTKLYRYDKPSNQFVEVFDLNNVKGNFDIVQGLTSPLAQLYDGTITWGDIEGDGDLDILQTGSNVPGGYSVVKIYRQNYTGNFSAPITISLPQIVNKEVTWGKFDGDNVLDLMMGHGIYRGLNLTNATFSVTPSPVITNAYNATPGTRISTTSKPTSPQLGISGNSIVWYDYSSYTSSNEIFFYNGISGGTPIELRNIGYSSDNINPQISGNNVVWQGYDGSDYEIFLYNSSSASKPIKLTNNYNSDTSPQISGNNIVWHGYDGSDYEIFFYNSSSGGAPIPITNNNYADYTPQISGNNVVWYGYDGNDYEIFFYNASSGGVPIQLTNNNYDDTSPQISGDNVVWYVYDGNDSEIFFYNNSSGIIQLTNNNYYDNSPQISGNNVVWYGYDGNDYEIFLYNSSYGGVPIQLTNNNYDDYSPQISGNNVVWYAYDGGDSEIFFYNGSSIFKITNNDYSDSSPKISGNNIVWSRLPGNNANYEIYTQDVSKLGVSSNDWSDFDSDNDLDYVQTGYNLNGVPYTTVFEQQSPGFFPADRQINLTGVGDGKAVWGDYDNNGKKNDILLSGRASDGSTVTKIYKLNVSFPVINGLSVKQVTPEEVPVLLAQDTNKNGILDAAERSNLTSLTGIYQGDISWQDFDGDGKLDILLTGFTGQTRRTADGKTVPIPVTKVYQLKDAVAGIYFDANINLSGVANSSVKVEDFDGDGKKDLLITGEDIFVRPDDQAQLSSSQMEGGNPTTTVYRNVSSNGQIKFVNPVFNTNENDKRWANFNYQFESSNLTQPGVYQLKGIAYDHPTGGLELVPGYGNESTRLEKTFNGVNDYVGLTTNTTYGGAITVEAWVYVENVKQNWARIIDFGNGQLSDNIILGWYGDSGLMFWETYQGANSQKIVTSEVFPEKQWVHVAAVNDGLGNASIYWNGQLKASSNNIFAPNYITRNNQYVGRSNWPYDAYFNGKMDELRVWNTARTQTEIQNNINTKLNPAQQSGLLQYLPFDDSQSLQGTAGQNIFVIGNKNQNFYNRTIIIEGFNPNLDQLQLYNNQDDYSVVASGNDTIVKVKSGTKAFLQTPNLQVILKGVTKDAIALSNNFKQGNVIFADPKRDDTESVQFVITNNGDKNDNNLTASSAYVVEGYRVEQNQLQSDSLNKLGVLAGGDGNDSLYGSQSLTDTKDGVLVTYLDGGAGNDTIKGSNLNLDNLGRPVTDVLLGWEGDDNLQGLQGRNYLDGGSGNDSLVGGLNSDTLVGGQGNDNLNGGGGVDTATYADSPAGVIVSLAAATASNDGYGTQDTFVKAGTLSTVENVSGSNYGDKLTGDNQNNLILGLAGNDTLSGGIGNDTLDGGTGIDSLEGGDGFDTLISGGGADILKGGLGVDTYIVRSNLLTLEQAFAALGGNYKTRGSVNVKLNGQDKAITWEMFRVWSDPDRWSDRQVQWEKYRAIGLEADPLLYEKAKTDPQQGWLRQSLAGTQITDQGGEDTLIIAADAPLSNTGLNVGKIGFYQSGNDLILDLNKDGIPNVQDDLTIKNFFDGNTGGTGSISTIRVSGLEATYYALTNGTNFNQPVITRIDPTINFNWGNQAPTALNKRSDNFGVIWQGFIKTNVTGSYKFKWNIDLDDPAGTQKVRLFINNTQITDPSQTLNLSANQEYNLRLEYIEKTGNAQVELQWSINNSEFQIIPESQLLSPQTIGAADILNTNSGFTPVLSPDAQKLNIVTTKGWNSSASFGDYDQDGNLDFLLVGRDQYGNGTARIYHNSGNFFNPAETYTIAFELTQLERFDTAVWGDYDNDGDLDILATGSNTILNSTTGLPETKYQVKVLLNQNGQQFTELPITGLSNQNFNSVVQAHWVDFDNDGKLDIVSTNDNQVKVYFANNSQQLISTIVNNGKITLGDLDNNGYVDIVLTGKSLASNSWTPTGTQSLSSTSLKNSSNNKYYQDFTLQQIDFDPSTTVRGFTDKHLYQISLSSNQFDTYLEIIDEQGNVFASDDDSGEGLNSLLSFEYDGNKYANYKIRATSYASDTVGQFQLSVKEINDSVQIFKNTGNSFTSLNQQSLNIYGAETAALGDYDLDGKLDLIITDKDRSKVYHNRTDVANQGNISFSEFIGRTLTGQLINTDSNNPLRSGRYYKSYTITDFVNDTNKEQLVELNLIAGFDTYLQIVQPDSTASSGYRVITYDDDSGEGLNSLLRFNYTPDLKNAQVWVTSFSSGTTGTYNLAVGGIGLSNSVNGATAWGDYDNDGDLDVALSGLGDNGSFTKVFLNPVVSPTISQTFSEQPAFLPGLQNGSTAWGDYDSDGDLDLLVTGTLGATGQPFVQLYRNNTFDPDLNSGTPNLLPTAPVFAQERQIDTVILFSWFDLDEGAEPYTYNLRIGTTPGGTDVLSPLADSEGKRTVAQIGNAGYVPRKAFNNSNFAKGVTHYWSVQSIDNSFAGSAFSEESSFTTSPFSSLSVGVTIIPPTLLVTKEAGDSASFSIRLNSRPTQNVVLEFTISDSTEGQLLLPSLTFTPDNWNVVQNLIVKGIDDTLDDGDINYALQTTVKSADLTYNNLPISQISLVNQDNDDVINRVSVASDGTQSNNSSISSTPKISANGNYIAFTSSANNLVVNDTNSRQDIFVYDLTTKQTTRVSLASNGTQLFNDSSNPSISADGSFVAFITYSSYVSNGLLIASDDISIYNRTTAQTTRINNATDGSRANSRSFNPSISGDGNYITYTSAATNLVLNDSNSADDIFVYNRNTGETTRVSIANDGTQANASSSLASISADGRYIVFQSNASNLVANDINAQTDIFLYDRTTSNITRVSVASDGTEANGNNYGASISADGGYIVYSSAASNLVANDNNNRSDVFVYDRTTKQTTRISIASNGTEGDDSSFSPSISSDGRYITYISAATNLVANDSNFQSDVFVYDRNTQQTTRVNLAGNGTQANFSSSSPSISGDGRYVAFDSLANNLVLNDTNNGRDIFVYDRSSTFNTISPNVVQGSWVDFDNDGDLDILSPLNTDLILYRNQGGNFTAVKNFSSASQGSWADYDNDGDFDLLVIQNNQANLYTNQNQTFNSSISLDWTNQGLWADYDNDGDQDMILLGRSQAGTGTRLLQNNSGIFSEQSILPSLIVGTSAVTGDYDHDGWIDLAITGNSGTKIYLGSVNGFKEYINQISGNYATITQKDVDNDQDLDLFFSNGTGISQILRNDAFNRNTAPIAPINFQSIINNTSVTLQWGGATDDHTRTAGLSYNLRVGTAAGQGDIFSNVVTINGQTIQLPTGNVGQGVGLANGDRAWTLKGLAPGVYFWSVQAIDGSLVSSSFSSEQTFSIAAPPVQETPTPNITFALSSLSVTEGDSGETPLTVTVQLSQASTQTITVDYSVYQSASNTAVANEDFQPLVGQITFNPGQTTQTINLTILGDTLPEAGETLTIALQNPTNAQLVPNQDQATVIINSELSDGVILLPDLQLLQISSLNTAQQTQTLDVGWKVQNIGSAGDAQTQYNTYIYLSTDDQLSQDDQFLGFNSQLLPGAGQTQSGTQSITIPQAVNSGNYYLLLTTNPEQEPRESSAFNNTIVRPISITTTILPDLKLVDVSSPATASPGTIIPVTGTVSNIGTVAAPAGWQILGYFSADNVLDANDISLVANSVTNPLLNAGATTSFSSQFTLPTTSLSQGYLLFNLVPANGNYDVDIKNNILAQAITIPYTSQGQISLSASLVSILEDDSKQLTYTFTRTGSLSNPLTVNFTVSGTAQFNSDYSQSGATTYTTTGGSITFAAGSNTAVLTLSTQKDAIAELDETITLTLSSSSDYILETTVPVTTTLVNDDRPLNDDFANAFSLNGSSISTSAANRQATAEVGEPVLLNETTSNSIWWEWTAPISGKVQISTNGSDVDTLLGVFTGASVSNLTLVTQDDDSGEGEASVVTFDAVAGTSYRILVDGAESNTGNISLNLQFIQTSLSIVDFTVIERDTLSEVIVTVTLDQASTEDITVAYTTNNGTAIADQDYTATSGTLTFAAGETSKTINIAILADALAEADETFTLNFSAITNNVLLPNATTLITVKDPVKANVSTTLGTTDNNLLLTGAAAINGTGNSADNIILGNSGNNILDGGDGNDTLDSGDGNDTLIGGNGSDRLDGGAGIDTVRESADVNFILSDSQLQGLGVDALNNIEQADLTAGTGNNILDASGFSGNALLSGQAGEDLLMGGLGNDTLNGGDGNDILSGGVGNDNIIGGLGNDLLVESGDLNFTLTNTQLMGNGTDTLNTIERVNLTGGDTDNILNAATFTAGSVVLSGGAGNDSLTGGSGNDTLDGGSGNDTLSGGLGNDVYVVDSSTDTIKENSGQGTDTILSSLTFSLSALPYVENLTLTGIDHLNATGNTTHNQITGNAGNNNLTGGLGNDTLDGGAGVDTVIESGNVNFTLTNTQLTGNGIDTLTKIEQADLTGSSGDNIIDASAFSLGDVTLNGGSGNDTLKGGTGNDILTGGLGNDSLDGGAGVDTVVESGNVNFTLTNTQLIGNGTDSLSNIESVRLTGGTGNNRLDASAFTGDAILDGGAGTDQLLGGTGNDTYIVDRITDSITDNGGTDTVVANFTYTLASLPNIENLSLSGNANINATGNNANNIITGNLGDNRLDGAAGNDTLIANGGNNTLIGGLGDDIYQVDNTTDMITELAGEGTDTVVASVSFSLAALSQVENLTLIGFNNLQAAGNASNNVITGNFGNNLLEGGAGNDTLNGIAGIDTLQGGTGDDTYIVDTTTDAIAENTAEGIDIVQSSVSYELGNNVENLLLTGTENIDGTGNALNNAIAGNSGDNILNGGLGNDTLVGGNGNDTYIIDSTADTITETANSGIDTVVASVDYNLGANSNLENLTLSGIVVNGIGNELDNAITGNAAANTLIGGSGNDTLIGGDGNDFLDGGTGNDLLTGGVGNDSYTVDSIGDTIIEEVNTGTDLVQSSVSWLLGTNLENLTLTGTEAINGTGNSLNNILTGNTAANILSGDDGNDTLIGGTDNDSLLGGAGNDSLDGGVGNDSLDGGLGNDIYTVDSLSDTITETANAGTDLVNSSVTWVLGANLENLTLLGTGVINGTGNILSNIITGNTAANILSGDDGNDTLIGGTGNDSLLGGLGNDSLDGGVGTDSLDGGLGNDIYTVDSLSDTMTEAANAGTDLVNSSVTWVLGANLENLTLLGTGVINGTGNSLSNILTGNTAANILSAGDGNDTLIGGSGNDSLNGGAGDDSLDGGIGTDSLDGGLGNDIYTVDSLSDTMTEAANAGTDLVNSSVTWVLGANLENLTLLGTGVINGTGNILSNIITGNTAANILSAGDGNDTLIGGTGNDSLNGGIGDDSLDGGVGTDSLDGGLGNDIYTVDSLSDTITEAANAGTDLVNSSVTWVLGANLENLTLLGNGVINGTGNSLNNLLTGNTAANILSGDDGNDTLIGGTGNDSLNGGAGNDLLIGGTGRDLLTGGTGRDSLYLTDTRTGGYDIITDFSVADDTLFISQAEFGLSQSPDTSLDPSLLRLGASATAASDRFIYNQTTGNLFFDADGIGTATQVQIAQLSNKEQITSVNIIVIA
ncbi:hemolysin-type calcium-binding region [Calothrix sp. NIES-2100]|uniref:FG-GAP-like repeat-containing protein n=1 Tax=Calothrix sp. NIES-2100 TaxID=1954172 RepID=UPI000B60BA1A|nr:hemolysin-type calcium-binding region [Calothrix sp. NIES-2100]